MTGKKKEMGRRCGRRCGRWEGEGVTESQNTFPFDFVCLSWYWLLSDWGVCVAAALFLFLCQIPD